MPDFLGMTAICLSSEQNFQQPGFLNIPCLQPSEPPLQGALHPVVATVGGPQLRAQDKEQGVRIGWRVSETNWHFKLSGLFLSGRCRYVWGNPAKN